MSMYNMVLGIQPAAKGVVAVIGLHPDSYQRFRDAWCEHLSDGSYRLVVLARCGGNNRELLDWEGIRDHKMFLGDEDWDYDTTFCLIYFKLPTEPVQDFPKDLWETVTELLHEMAFEGPRDLTREWKASVDGVTKGIVQEASK